MVDFMLFVLQLIFLAPRISCEFTNPGTQNEILILGQPIRVTYRGINYTNYTIALWQQLPQGGGAILGPALYANTIFFFLKYKGLSTGAKTSIAVGAVGGALAIIGAAAFFVRYRMRKNREAQKISASSGDNHLYPPSYCSPPAPGAELYYKSHGVAFSATHNEMPRDYGFSGQPIAHARHLNQAPVEMGT
ncbi:hypothetical protein BM221_005640 [Beauveria bassiana]|uniref:Uncharacterized protein n=1 Tax=Beauveria bassiana TaxID=176275 RepID=A0A2N6NP75_BEABA|nr:hypothetical protein BM221_005640 [Beauveria bassiana]